MEHRLLQGIVPGRSHILDARNCQDALSSITFEINSKSYVAGVVADGCGGGKHSEVGAQLAVQFIPREIRRLVKNGLPLEPIPNLIFEHLIHFLKTIVAAYNFADLVELAHFVNHHFLFTVLGFIVGPEQTLVFAAGDGIVIINDDIHLRDQHNAPAYIGYHLVDRRYLGEDATPLAYTFDLYTVPTETLKRLAIGSDAWMEEQALLDQVWGLKPPAGLQLQMNRWSDARHLKDDASMIVVELETTTRGE